MIIDGIEFSEHGDRIRISSRVQIDSQPGRFPERLWYEIPCQLHVGSHRQMDAFAAALLLLAMHLGEAIHFQGSISRKLLRGLNTYQTIFHAWFPGWFQKIEIYPENVVDSCHTGVKGLGLAFSGGVDSTYTLLTHLTRCEKDLHESLTHGIFVHGFDIPLKDEAIYTNWADIFQPALAEQGVELVRVSTNVRTFVNRLPWIVAHGSSLCSVALILQGILGRFYVPASAPYTDLEPWGSHPISDPLFSTETLEIVHDGCLPRVEKICALAHWRPAQSWLRVCWKDPSSAGNCCRCHNCLTTMIALELAGTLPEFAWFPDGLNRNRVSRMMIPAAEFSEAEALLAYARRTKDVGLTHALRVAMKKSLLNHFLKSWKNRIKGILNLVP